MKISLERRLFCLGLSCSAVSLLKATPTMAQTTRIEDFTDGDAPAWRYVSDRVMGGVSDGTMQMVRQGSDRFARLTGTVSTENNGGFIQMRRDLREPFPASSQGLRLRLRGNGERYYVHLRPSSSRRPWQYFAASFEADNTWQSIDLPWSAFSAQGGLNATFDQSAITSMGLVAYGADYQALLDVAWIDLY